MSLNSDYVPQRVRYPHYHKKVPPGATHIDVYRVLKSFEVHDPCVQHAVKKLLVAGGRGQKPEETDIDEAIASLQRYKEMVAEEREVRPPSQKKGGRR